MDNRAPVSVISPSTGFPTNSHRQNMPRPGDLVQDSLSSRHRPTKPSSLQLNVTPVSPDEQRGDGMVAASSSTASSPAMRSQVLVADQRRPPQSPRERLDQFLRQEDTYGLSPRQSVTELRTGKTGSNASRSASDPINSPSRSYKAHSQSSLLKSATPSPLLQTSHVLGPLSSPSHYANMSPPLSPSTMAAYTEGKQSPRNTSIDSQISGVSLATTQSSKTTSSSLTVSPTMEIASMIKAAGSAETVIQRLLKDKQQTDARCAQLWTLVEKQRKLLLGLTQDLDRTMKDNERYRQKLQDQTEPAQKSSLKIVGPAKSPAAKTPFTVSVSASLATSPPTSDSSSDNEAIADPKLNTRARNPQEIILSTTSHLPSTSLTTSALHTNQPDSYTGDWMQAKTRKEGNFHTHKQTSSSDLGLFNIPQPLASNKSTPYPPSLSQTTPVGNSFVINGTTPTSNSSLLPKAHVVPELSKSPIDPSPTARKAPPAPLNLIRPQDSVTSASKVIHSGSEYESDSDSDDVDEVLRSFERGRKMTREDDDREREALLRKQQKATSQSSKKNSASRSLSNKTKAPPGSIAISSPVPNTKYTVPPPLNQDFDRGGASAAALANASLSMSPQQASLSGMLQHTNSQPAKSPIATRHLTTTMPMSPGLPLSPRPIDRPTNPPVPRTPREPPSSLMSSKSTDHRAPLSPRPPVMGLPLSPRLPCAPAFPHPTIASTAQLPSSKKEAASEARSDSSHSNAGLTVYKGLMNDEYPGLLLPPNAVPWVRVTVVSSRLRPSRHSLVIRNSDDEPVFTLGLSARSDGQQLWMIEKPITSLLQLDHQLRQQCPTLNVKLPDRSLFTGHAPARIDARRAGLENYFDQLLDTQLDEKSALTLCQYLSTHVMESGSSLAGNSGDQTSMKTHAGNATSSAQFGGTSTLAPKEGYLTKRGKNFGGWKVRYFVLDDPILRYYEAPNGPVLGTIKLQRAQIGKQTVPKGETSSGTDSDVGQFRHAFLIREPKRKDSSSYLDHVFCAENDEERDAWVAALVAFTAIEESDSNTRSGVDNTVGSHVSRMPSSASSTARSTQQPRPYTNHSGNGPSSLEAIEDDLETHDSLQTIPYDHVKPAEALHVSVVPDQAGTNAEEDASPTTPSSQSHPSSERAASVQSRTISGPQNGTRISDAGAWGNKPPTSPMLGSSGQQQPRDKKRSLFGFHSRDATGSNRDNTNGSISSASGTTGSALHPFGGVHADLSAEQVQYQEQIFSVRAAFGASLTEAVEFCSPRGPNVPKDNHLPAVVYRCLEYFEAKNAVAEEGIFRQSGSSTVIRHLKNRFNTEVDVDLVNSEQWYEVHAVGSLLKQYLRELPQSVLTKELGVSFTHAIEIRDEQQKLAAYNALVHRLPSANFHTLKALCQFLVKVVNNTAVNKMDVRNVGIVFSPTLGIATPILVSFLTEFDKIFASSENANVDSPAHLRAASGSPAGMSMDDIRSPRRQMFSDLSTPAATQTSFGPASLQSTPPTASNGQFNAFPPSYSHTYQPSRQEPHQPGGALSSSYQTHAQHSFQPPQQFGLGFTPVNMPTIGLRNGSAATPDSSSRQQYPGMGSSTTKQSRRESSMLLMSSSPALSLTYDPSQAQAHAPSTDMMRKSSLPILRQ